MSLEERVASLERDNRRWKLFALGSSLILLIVFGVGAAPKGGAPPRAVRCTELAVLDENRDVRIRLKADDKGGTLSFLDTMGRARIIVAQTEAGNVLSLYAPDGKARLLLTQQKRGAALGMKDNKGILRVLLATPSDKGTAQLKVTNPEGKASVWPKP
jgi:hypothetical protein